MATITSMKNRADKAIKNVVAAFTYEDPISEKTGRNRRNALIISGLSLLHFWNPIELTGLGFRLEHNNPSAITLILFSLLGYLSFTLLLNTISDLMESIERINASDVQQTRENWSIAVEWAKSLKEVNSDGTYPSEKGYV